MPSKLILNYRPRSWFTSLLLLDVVYGMIISRLGEIDKGYVIMVGARGFEPPTSCSQGRRASQTALRPVCLI